MLRDVVRRRRRRRRRWAHAPVIHAASHVDHEKRVGIKICITTATNRRECRIFSRPGSVEILEYKIKTVFILYIKRVAWFSISMHTCGPCPIIMDAPLGGPSGRRSSAIRSAHLQNRSYR